MSEYWRVKSATVIMYGSVNRAYVYLRVNQKWRLKALASNKFPFYTLERSGILIDVMPDDFKRIFDEVKADAAESEG